jgi:hypothetical protein
MTNREPLAVFAFSLLTFGIYGIFWWYWTKQEMNAKGAAIPTLLLILLPFASIYWLWKWSEGVERTTGGAMSGVAAFFLTWLFGCIGQAIVQDKFNLVGKQVAAG